MRIPTTAQVGCVLILAAVTGFWGTRVWVESRTLRAVDIPVSLAHGTLTTARFKLNVHGFYSINIGLPQGGNLSCDGVGLETRRISSTGGRTVYRYHWLEEESGSSGRNTIAGGFLGGFEGKPGHYDLEIEVVSDSGCLDASKPRLYIIASNEDFYRWNNYYDNAVWISFVLGSIGLAALIVDISERFRRRSKDNSSLDFFEPRSIDSYRARQRLKPAPWTPFFSRISLLYSQVLLLAGIGAVLVLVAWGNARRSQGLLVLTYFPESPMFTHMPCAQALVVRVESDEAWYLNSKRIEPDDFAEALRAQMGASRNCIVFFDAEPDVDYAVAIHAIDLIEQSQGTVVLLTPETKPLRIP
jgi:hypothetical protein